MSWWQIVVGAVVALVAVWVVLVLALLVIGRRTSDPVTLRDAVRLGPDVVRLVRRLAADDALPRSVRWRLWLLLAYLLLPIDLVPDFLPVIGYADDAVLVALVLRSVVRTAGRDVLVRHWPGTPDGLAVVRRLSGV